MKRVKANKDVCIGCGICELACLTAHSQSQDLIIAFREERALGLTPCKRVERLGPACAGLSCRHCDDPYCVSNCISGALTKDIASGRVTYDENKCVGCWSCLVACPFGSIARHPVREKIVKCDLCAGRDIPACVQACPNLALVFEE